MSKERLFQDIRRENIVLWAGAGFSLYAGYASGRALANMLFESLTKPEQEQVDSSRPLPAFAEDYVTLRNYAALFQLLKKEFSRRPKSLKTHQKLAKIPFISTIITTNYDNLFELAYEDRLDKILSDENLPYLGRDKVRLYKVHGDLQKPSSIVISEEHYRNFFAKHDKLLWAMIESLFATKTMLFVGYGLEDSNILALFEQTLDALGSNTRGGYFVAPGLAPLRIEWLKKKGLAYIDSTGEQLVDELYEDIKQYALQDLKKGEASSDTTGRFLDLMGLDFSLKSGAEGYSIENLSRKQGLTNYGFNFKVEGKTALGKQLRKFANGRLIGSVEVPVEQIKHFSHHIEGLVLPVDFPTFYLVSAPAKSAVLDIQFADGFTADGVKVDLYGTNTLMKVVARYRHAQFIFSGRKKNLFDKMEFVLEHDNGQFVSVKQEIDVYQILKHLGEGTPFKCFSEQGDAVFSGGSTTGNSLAEEATYWLSYFEDLQAIQQHFGIVFKNFAKNDSCINEVKKLANILAQRQIEVQWDGRYTVTKQQDWEQADKILHQPEVAYTCLQQIQYEGEFTVLGKELSLPYTELHMIDEMVIEKDVANESYHIKSRNGKMKIQFYNSLHDLFAGIPIENR